MMQFKIRVSVGKKIKKEEKKKHLNLQEFLLRKKNIFDSANQFKGIDSTE